MVDFRTALDAATTLPVDAARAALAGRVWLPQANGPAVAPPTTRRKRAIKS